MFVEKPQLTSRVCDASNRGVIQKRQCKKRRLVDIRRLFNSALSHTQSVNVGESATLTKLRVLRAASSKTNEHTQAEILRPLEITAGDGSFIIVAAVIRPCASAFHHRGWTDTERVGLWNKYTADKCQIHSCSCPRPVFSRCDEHKMSQLLCKLVRATGLDGDACSPFVTLSCCPPLTNGNENCADGR